MAFDTQMYGYTQEMGILSSPAFISRAPEGMWEAIYFTFGVCLFVCVCVRVCVRACVRACVCVQGISPINTWPINMKLRVELPVLYA